MPEDTELVVAYGPGALVGYKLRECCGCPCHQGKLMHFVACCESVRGFSKFPELDKYDTPVEKLPNCPACDEDKLGVINHDFIICYACSWKLLRGDLVGAYT